MLLGFPCLRVPGTVLLDFPCLRVSISPLYIHKVQSTCLLQTSDGCGQFFSIPLGHRTQCPAISSFLLPAGHKSPVSCDRFLKVERDFALRLFPEKGPSDDAIGSNQGARHCISFSSYTPWQDGRSDLLRLLLEDLLVDVTGSLLLPISKIPSRMSNHLSF